MIALYNTPEVIAERTLDVPDGSGIDGFNRRILAGQPVPPDLLTVYRLAVAETVSAA